MVGPHDGISMCGGTSKTVSNVIAYTRLVVSLLFWLAVRHSRPGVVSASSGDQSHVCTLSYTYLHACAMANRHRPSWSQHQARLHML